MNLEKYNNIIFKECIEALGDNVKILSFEESNKIFTLLEKLIPFTPWGKIEWTKVDQNFEIESSDQIIPLLKKLLQNNIDPKIYILWNDGSLPVIETDIFSAINHFDDVIYLETWFFNPVQRYVVEILAPGVMHLGVCK